MNVRILSTALYFSPFLQTSIFAYTYPFLKIENVEKYKNARMYILAHLST